MMAIYFFQEYNKRTHVRRSVLRRNIIQIIVIFLLFLTACTKSKEPPKDSLVVALAAEPKTLDPRYATDANGMRIGFLIFNSPRKNWPRFKCYW